MAPKHRPNRKRRTHPWHHPLRHRIQAANATSRAWVHAALQQFQTAGHRHGPRLQHIARVVWQRTLALLHWLGVNAMRLLRHTARLVRIAARHTWPQLQRAYRHGAPRIQATAHRLWTHLDPSRVRIDAPRRHAAHTLRMTATFLCLFFAAGALLACAIV